MPIPDIIIAIDGYSSTGKSSFAKLIAGKLGFLYLDSGALYRAVTLFALDNGMIYRGVIDEPALRKALKVLKVSFKPSAESGKYHACMNGKNVERRIRTLRVSEYVSNVAELPFVRSYVDNILHSYGKKGRIVMDGRDIGTAVFPYADLKIFMVAEQKIRAGRRLREMEEKGEKATLDEVLDNLKERDERDSSRTVHPLSKADDAIVLDNSYMTMDDEMDWLEGILRERWPQK
ncbi:MAG: (d)CMP kinase [Bacteroidales bacterium]|jgi:cytidylate kinase|nr:(d)CMP kinase [Bacteroidales bacterium]MCI2122465.1 (d)CMP kinase [Bacteroidales bacterium]MCI2145445.1 (d)CMP kinase [Bacteroidales bacterium]